MSARRRWWSAALAGSVASVLVVLPACGSDVGAVDDDVLGPGAASVILTVRHSKFVPETIDVAKGTSVRFVIRNTDFIDHEFIVGDAAVHRRHESGTHASHGAIPGEVSVKAGEEAETTYRFTDAGTVLFACHLPKHLDYGMKGHAEVHRSGAM